ncbi:MAG: TadE/TadG family type IV pilus assembly protein [Granulosicoccaceae bacterium]
MFHLKSRSTQSGATMVEFIFAAPAVLFLGLGSVQAGLIYHGKATLNYATFEAARAGAVDHAQLESMKNELGFRLAPLMGGDGTAEKAAEAISMSIAGVNLPLQTKLEILNPTVQAFDDWGQVSLDSGVRVIPNSHLRNRHAERSQVGSQSGLNLHDANLLKIKVTHGFQMKIPFIAAIFAKAMVVTDLANAHYYALKQIPITSVVTVRMQNEAWESQIIAEAGVAPLAANNTSTNQVVSDNPSTAVAVTPCTDPYGLSGHNALMSSVTYPEGGQDSGVCAASVFVNSPISNAIGGAQTQGAQPAALSDDSGQGADGCT